MATNPLDILGLGLGTVGAIVGGQQQQPDQSSLHLVNPQQQLLYNKMIQGLLGGGGDFGYGSNIKQGTSQLQQMMAQRGIKVGSGGAYTGAYGNMVGNALGQDAQARRQYALNLLQSPLQIASGQGNFIPGSPSTGGNKDDSAASFGGYVQHGGAPVAGGWQNYMTGAFNPSGPMVQRQNQQMTPDQYFNYRNGR